MRNFLKNWNYRKHAAAVSCIYAGIIIIGNALLEKNKTEDQRISKSCCPKVICGQMSKKQKIFNGVLGGMYGVDMTLSYVLIKGLNKNINKNRKIKGK